jgi:restriction system protein
MAETKVVWGIHTTQENLFLPKNIIGIGWEDMGDIKCVGDNRDAIKKKYAEVYPDATAGSVATCVGMLYRFVYEAQIGDYVIYPSKADRKINIGVIESDYYNETAEPNFTQRRKVKWLKSFPRTDFSQGALYEVGSALSFFQIKNYADEYLTALEGKKASLDLLMDESIGVTADEIQEIAKDFVLKNLSKKLKGYDFEQFVANLLNAMGYRTKVSKQGGDSGIDIIAYKDEFPPRICIQVKSVDGDIKETTIQSLRGAMSEGDYGVFVTLSDFTANARAYLDHHPIIKGLNGSAVADLVLRYYEKLDDKYKEMIPLKRIYMPVINHNEVNGEA